jgi:glycosyltransferase involved in cell wall biosynthesis
MEHIETTINNLKAIAKSQDITAKDAFILAQSLDRYFGEFKRDQAFKQVEVELLPRFSEFLGHFNKENGVSFAQGFFLFSYTLAQDYVGCQSLIHEYIASPYKEWVKKNWMEYKGQFRQIVSGEKIVFLCRHAVTQGMYAPGKSIYSLVKSLIDNGDMVELIVLGNIDQTFKNLAINNSNLSIYNFDFISFDNQLYSLLHFFKEIKPKMILTELEFDIASLMAIIGLPVPVILLSAGFYKVPWFDKIGLPEVLFSQKLQNKDDRYFQLPTFLSAEILNPKIDCSLVKNAKKILKINENDIVIGSFARMEKFKIPFLNLLEEILNKHNRVKVLLAGSNDTTNVRKYLKKYIDDGRVIVLGEEGETVPNVQILGNCIDIGLDTFPTHSGFSILELMAKGVPVISKNDAELGQYSKQRLPELVRKSSKSIIELISNLVEDEELRKLYSLKTYDFMDQIQKNNQVVKIIHEIKKN